MNTCHDDHQGYSVHLGVVIMLWLIRENSVWYIRYIPLLVCAGLTMAVQHKLFWALNRLEFKQLWQHGTLNTVHLHKVRDNDINRYSCMKFKDLRHSFAHSSLLNTLPWWCSLNHATLPTLWHLLVARELGKPAIPLSLHFISQYKSVLGETVLLFFIWMLGSS